MKTCILALIFMVSIPFLQAQETRPTRSPEEGGLPIGLTEEERSRLEAIGSRSTITPAPTGPVRAAAEWEESVGVFMLWSNAGLIDELQKDSDVYIITESKSWWLSWLASNGIPSTNFHFLIAPTNTIYTRDYGPWFIWDGNGEFGLVDTIYNRPRPLDDVIPEKIATEYGIPYYGMDMVHTGGNYYTDGYGNAWSTTLVFLENSSMSEFQVRQLMYDYLGITRYNTPQILYSIMHMDTFGKPVAPDTLVWGAFPEFTTPWLYSENALKWLRVQESPYGWPYKIHRMPLWDYGSSWTAYLNALQTNHKIITAKYGTAHDAEAKQIYEAAAPGYRVVNVDSGGTNWGDSIHCRTRNYHRGDTIRIYPRPHWECADSETEPYVVSAEVIPHPFTSLDGNPEILWTTTGGPPFNSSPMTPTGNPGKYTGAIPAQAHGTTVSYYIHARDLAGRTKDCPLVAPDYMFLIEVKDDKTPPELDHDVIHGLTLDDWPKLMTCTAMDNTGVPELYLEYEINGVPQTVVPLDRTQGCFEFTGYMDGTVALGDHIVYRISAVDSAKPANVRSSPTSGWNHFTIDPKNRVLVIELDKTPDSGEVLVDVCDDLGLSVHYTDQWPASPNYNDALMICLGMAPYNKGLSYTQANSLVSFLTAGGSAYMEGGNCWSEDTYSGVYNDYFGIAASSNGEDLVHPIAGLSGRFTEGMGFDYSGEWWKSDHLTSEPLAEALLESNGQTKSVAFSTGTYSTAAVSFQLGSLVESSTPSHVKKLVAGYLKHIGMDINLVVHSRVENTRSVTFDLEGDPNAVYLLFYALGPGYFPYGPAGIVQIDPATLGFGLSGVLPANGHLGFDALIPDNPDLIGVELYFQGYLEEMGTGNYFLTNRDRITLAFD